MLPLSRVMSRSGTIPEVASGGASILYRAYCSCGGSTEPDVSDHHFRTPMQRCRLCSGILNYEMNVRRRPRNRRQWG